MQHQMECAKSPIKRVRTRACGPARPASLAGFLESRFSLAEKDRQLNALPSGYRRHTLGVECVLRDALAPRRYNLALGIPER
jgi:hypothetical protein